MLNIEINTYTALPCNTEKFVINGIDADIDDFGYMCDTNRSSAPDYGCGCMEFVPSDEKILDAMNKYGITQGEFYEVQNELESDLYVGCCGWCI